MDQLDGVSSQGGSFHNLSGQSFPAFDHSHGLKK